MTQTLDDYAKRYKDGKNMAELKQFPLGDGGILACGKGVEPNTTVAVVAVVAGANHVDMMAVETPAGAEVRIIAGGAVQPIDTNAKQTGAKLIKACQKLGL
jgi:hypothetical protein